MSLGYAEKLSYREDVGSVGMPEMFDSPKVLHEKIEELAVLVRKSKHLVVFTGAGISTSSGIPDFRGPKGVWTLQRAGKGVPDASLPFHRAVPTLTHMALVELERAGLLKFVISQNVDSLHLRSGLPREKLAELHGNSFKEICPSCKTEYLRDFEIETIGLKDTTRRCSDKNCGTRLKDTVLDWEDALPPEEMNSAKEQCRAADLVLCLGTSLQITPACNMPLMSIKNGGKVAIVNLQATPKDKKASLVIHGLVDKVIAGVMCILNLRIPPYIRTDFVHLSLRHTVKKKCVRWTMRVTSIHGLRAPLPFLRSIEVSFPERPDMKPVVLMEQPFSLQRETSITRSFFMLLTLNFSDGCGCSSSSIEVHVDFQVLENWAHNTSGPRISLHFGPGNLKPDRFSDLTHRSCHALPGSLSMLDPCGSFFFGTVDMNRGRAEAALVELGAGYGARGGVADQQNGLLEGRGTEAFSSSLTMVRGGRRRP